MPRPTGNDWRSKQRAGSWLSMLERHLNGDIELTQTQIRAAEILLKKALPDLKAEEVKVTYDMTPEFAEIVKNRLPKIGQLHAIDVEKLEVEPVHPEYDD